VALATPVEPLEQHPQGTVAELLQAGGVPMDSVVIVAPAECGVPPLEEPWPPEVAVLLAPRGAALQGAAECLPCGPAFAVLLPRAVLAPPTRKPENLAAGLPSVSVPTARDDPRLGSRQFQSAFLSSFPQHFVEAFRIPLFFKRAHEIVRVADEARFSSTVWFDHVCQPDIQHVVQEHIGQDW